MAVYHDSNDRIHCDLCDIGFMLFRFVPLLIGILSFKNGETGIGSVSIASFIISMLFFALFVMSDKPEFKDTIIQNEGLWQRLNLLFMYLPLLIVSIKHTRYGQFL